MKINPEVSKSLKRVVARELLILLACAITAYFLDRYISRIVSPHSFLNLGFTRVFIIVFLSSRFFVWVLKTLWSMLAFLMLIGIILFLVLYFR